MRKIILLILLVSWFIPSIFAQVSIQETNDHTALQSKIYTGEFFPLSNGSRYSYRWSYSGKTGIETSVVQKLNFNSFELYYFLNEYYLQKVKQIIAQDGPGLHAYYIKEGLLTYIILPSGLFVGELTLSDISTRQPMIKFPLRIGNSTKVKRFDGKTEVILTIEGFESVEVPAGNFPNCVKMKMTQTWIDSKYEDYITVFWLAKDVGKVKLYNSKGRVEELVSSSVLR